MSNAVPGAYSTTVGARARVAARFPIWSHLARDGKPAAVGVGE